MTDAGLAILLGKHTVFLLPPPSGWSYVSLVLHHRRSQHSLAELDGDDGMVASRTVLYCTSRTVGQWDLITNS